MSRLAGHTNGVLNKDLQYKHLQPWIWICYLESCYFRPNKMVNTAMDLFNKWRYYSTITLSHSTKS